MIDTLIFDLDGTVIDSMGIWGKVDKEFLQNRNIPVPLDLFDDMTGGNSFSEIAKYFKIKFDLPETENEIMQEWTNMVAHKYATEVGLKNGSKFFITEFADIYKFGIGTSNNIELTKSVLKAHSLERYFQTIITGSDVKIGKPNPEVFLKVAERLNSNPKNCIVFEDTLVGILAAKSAGMTAFAIADKHSEHQKEKIMQNCDGFFNNFFEIYDFIKFNKQD